MQFIVVIAKHLLTLAMTLCLVSELCAQRPNSRGAHVGASYDTRSSTRQRSELRGPILRRSIHESDEAGDDLSPGGPSYGSAHDPGPTTYTSEESGPYPAELLCAPAGCGPVQQLLDWSRCDVIVGTTAFSNATNFLSSGTNTAGQIEGNFGFQEGFNFGNCLPGLLGGQVGAQVGLRAIQSQLYGNSAGADTRHQLFATAGLFRRVDYGVQGGLVVDYLHDDWLPVVDLGQLRGELGFAFSPCHDAGFRFTSSLNTDHASARLAGATTPTAVSLTTLDTYRFFYRCGLGDEGRASAELNAGFTDDRDALLGLSLTAPLHGCVGLSATTTYLLPHSGANPAYANENWNMGLALVWSPGRAFGCDRDYYRPLFGVADNGSLLTKRDQ